MTTLRFSFVPLLTWNAAKLDNEGKPDAAIKQYLAALRVSALSRSLGLDFSSDCDSAVYGDLRNWATRPHQTPERVIGAARQLDRFTCRLPVGGTWLKEDNLSVRRFLSNGRMDDYGFGLRRAHAAARRAVVGDAMGAHERESAA